MEQGADYFAFMDSSAKEEKPAEEKTEEVEKPSVEAVTQ